MDNEEIKEQETKTEQPVSQDTSESKIPEGTEVIGEKVLCSKHGDVSGSLTKFQYLRIEENENHEKSIQPYNAIFCTQCICDVLFELQKQGKIGTLTREKQVATHENAAKIRAYYAEKLAKVQEEIKKQEDSTEKPVDGAEKETKLEEDKPNESKAE